MTLGGIGASGVRSLGGVGAGRVASSAGWSTALKVGLSEVWELDNSWVGAHAGLDLTPVNSPAFSAPGYVGSHKAALVAASSQYAERADGSSVAWDWSTEFSLSFWILGGWGAIAQQIIMSKWAYQTAGEWAVEMQSNGSLRVYVAESPTAAGAVQCNKAGAFLSARAYHCVITFDGAVATATDRWKLCVDGVATAWTVSASVPASLQAGSAALRFGAFSGSLTRYLNNPVDQPAIWRRTLAQTDVDELYNSGAGLPYAA